MRSLVAIIAFLALLGLPPGSYKATVTAHAGAVNTEDNTLRSVIAGLASRADIIEVDVRFFPDGTPALGHDALTPESVLLADVFKRMLAYPSVSVNLDMKEKTHVPRIAELVAQYGLEGRVFMTGLGKNDCVNLRDCGLPYYLNSTDVAAAKQVGALGVNIGFESCTEELVQSAHGEGLLVSVWTVNEKPDMLTVLRLGADNITTRKPILLRRVMAYA